MARHRCTLLRRREKRTVRYPVVFGTRIDWETMREIDDIALFDRKKPAAWLRDLIVDAVKRYQRNPQYKKFKRDLEARLKGSEK